MRFCAGIIQILCDNFHLRPKNSIKKFFFKEFLEKRISKNTFHAVVFYVAYTNITNIYDVEKWEFAK